MGGMQGLPSSPLSHPLHNAKGMGKGRQVLNNLGVVGEYYISRKIREGFEQRNIRRNMGGGGRNCRVLPEYIARKSVPTGGIGPV